MLKAICDSSQGQDCLAIFIANLESLPDELLAEIFSCFTLLELIKFARFSVDTSEIIQRYLNYLFTSEKKLWHWLSLIHADSKYRLFRPLGSHLPLHQQVMYAQYDFAEQVKQSRSLSKLLTSSRRWILKTMLLFHCRFFIMTDIFQRHGIVMAAYLPHLNDSPSDILKVSNEQCLTEDKQEQAMNTLFPVIAPHLIEMSRAALAIFKFYRPEYISSYIDPFSASVNDIISELLLVLLKFANETIRNNHYSRGHKNFKPLVSISTSMSFIFANYHYQLSIPTTFIHNASFYLTPHSITSIEQLTMELYLQFLSASDVQLAFQISAITGCF